MTNTMSSENMNLPQLQQQVKEKQKNASKLATLLKQVARLDQDRGTNYRKIGDALQKLQPLIEELGKFAECASLVQDWTADYRNVMDRTHQEFKYRFAVELEKELKEHGLSLAGRGSELRSGLYTIELDFDKLAATLWYGPRQERLKRCALSATEVAKALEKLSKNLGSGLNPGEFHQQLRNAYQQVLTGTARKSGAPAPVIQVLSELSHLLQNARFHNDPRKEYYKGYSRADFSYDLFRTHRSKPDQDLGRKWHLVVAARALTRRRSDFLWVPDDGTGKGTAYAYLQFEERTA